MTAQNIDRIQTSLTSVGSLKNVHRKQPSKAMQIGFLLLFIGFISASDVLSQGFLLSHLAKKSTDHDKNSFPCRTFPKCNVKQVQFITSWKFAAITTQYTAIEGR